uniref:Alternative protein CSF2RB n=1 Tax=Homo sapiens TaxID=9606 RepID=L0R5A1_HUMAN|nr:alternative protein CSF2RB [Homo sapiens]
MRLVVLRTCVGCLSPAVADAHDMILIWVQRWEAPGGHPWGLGLGRVAQDWARSVRLREFRLASIVTPRNGHGIGGRGGGARDAHERLFGSFWGALLVVSVMSVGPPVP